MKKMTNEQVFQFASLITNLFTEFKQDASINAKFIYALKRNGDIIKPILPKIIEGMKPKEVSDPKKTEDYNAKRTLYCKEYANKDENGNPIIIDEKYDIAIDKKQEFEEKIKLLNEEYKEQVEEQTKNILAQKEFLKKECEEEINFYRIKLEWMPETNFITPEIMELLYLIIEE